MARWSELWRILRGIRREAEKLPARAEIPPIPPPVQKRTVQAPPVQPRIPDRRQEQKEEDRRQDNPEQEIELLGRDASYDDQGYARSIENEVRVVKSSNVYSYYFEQETATSGILFVTFLFWEPGVKPDDRTGPGLTYAYYDFPTPKYQSFDMASSSSAGKAVWDFCRERGTVHGHQHRYRLIQSSGNYVPRKATAKGFSERTLVSPGLSPSARRETFRRSETRRFHSAKQFFKRSTLAPSAGASQIKRGDPDRGNPNRGNPNRGEPNRGT